MRFHSTLISSSLLLLLMVHLFIPSFATSTDDDPLTDDGKYENCWWKKDMAVYDYEKDYMEHYITSLTVENDIEEAETCENVCERIEPYATEIMNGRSGGTIFDRIMNFDLFDRLMNGLSNIIHRHDNDNDQRYMVPTNMVLKLLSKYSAKLKSFATMLRNETIHNKAMVNTTTDVIPLLFELSAENMESVATVLDPILYELSQYETMNVSTISCSLLRLTSYIQDETFPNIVSILEILVSMSNSTQLKDSYTQYITTNLTTILKRVNHDDVTQYCSKEINSTSMINNSMEEVQSGKSLKERINDIQSIDVTNSLSNVSSKEILSIIFYAVEFIILLPVTIVAVVLTALIIVLGSIVLYLYALFPNFVICNLGIILILIFNPIFVIIFFPLIIIVGIIDAIILLYFFIKDNILNQPSISNSHDVMYRVSMVLESPIEQIIDAIRHIDTVSINEEVQLHCDIKTLACKNNAAVNALPF